MDSDIKSMIVGIIWASSIIILSCGLAVATVIHHMLSMVELLQRCPHL